jgi:hypothetical protein
MRGAPSLVLPKRTREGERGDSVGYAVRQAGRVCCRLFRLLSFLSATSSHWGSVPKVQRTGASRYADWRCGRREWLAPVAGLSRRIHAP